MIGLRQKLEEKFKQSLSFERDYTRDLIHHSMWPIDLWGEMNEAIGQFGLAKTYREVWKAYRECKRVNKLAEEHIDKQFFA